MPDLVDFNKEENGAHALVDFNKVEGHLAPAQAAPESADEPADTKAGLGLSDIARLSPAGPALALKDAYDVLAPGLHLPAAPQLPGDLSDAQKDSRARAFSGGFTLGHAGNVVGKPEVYAQAAEDQPAANLIGSVALPLPGTGKLKGGAKLAARLGIGAGVGGAMAAAKPGADATDVGLGMGVGAGGAGVGELLGLGLGKFFGKVSGRASQGVADAEALAGKQAADAAADETASALGKYGSETQKASRILENAEREVAIGRVAQANGAAPGPQHQAAVEFLQSPEAQALRAKVLEHNITQGPGQVGRAAGARSEWEALLEGEGDRAEAAKQALLDKPVLSNFVKKYAKRGAAVGVGALAGYLTGHPSIGTSLGAAAAAVMGDPGTATANLLKSPAGRKTLWGALEFATKGAPDALATASKLSPVVASKLAEYFRGLKDEEEKPQ